MGDNHERSVPAKGEWLDDVLLESSKEETLPKDGPSCDVTLKIFDEPYIPPVYSKVVRTSVVKEVEARMTGDVSNTGADENRHQCVSGETFGVGSSCLEEIGVVRSREPVENVEVEPSGGDQREDHKSHDDAMFRFSESYGYRDNGDGSTTLMARKVANEVRPFACNMCSYNSNSSYHLKRHMLGHSGEKPFGCNFCDYKSHRADKVKRHARTHTGEKPFGCTYCNYKASRADHLKAHIRSHMKYS